MIVYEHASKYRKDGVKLVLDPKTPEASGIKTGADYF